jgi:exopolyphosphatase/pppGpp-phosphohydrolase
MPPLQIGLVYLTSRKHSKRNVSRYSIQRVSRKYKKELDELKEEQEFFLRKSKYDYS